MLGNPHGHSCYYDCFLMPSLRSASASQDPAQSKHSTWPRSPEHKVLLGKTTGPQGEVGTRFHMRTCKLRYPPSAAQPPTSETTRRPTGLIKMLHMAPGRQQLLSRDLQADLDLHPEGIAPRSLTERPRAKRPTGQRLQR